MVNPFYYSKSKHRRTLNPPAYRNYRQYKPALREEFVKQCVYCRALDTVKGIESFGVDHYRPKSRFPNLLTEYLNLFYACNRCNSLKRNFWPSPAQVTVGQFVPNPCEHVMFEHLRYKGGSVAPTSKAGEWTTELLDLNDPSAVEFRDAFIKMLEATNAQIASSQYTAVEVKKKLSTVTTEKERIDATNELNQAELNIQLLQAALKKLFD